MQHIKTTSVPRNGCQGNYKPWSIFVQDKIKKYSSFANPFLAIDCLVYARVKSHQVSTYYIRDSILL